MTQRFWDVTNFFHFRDLELYHEAREEQLRRQAWIEARIKEVGNREILEHAKPLLYLKRPHPFHSVTDQKIQLPKRGLSRLASWIGKIWFEGFYVLGDK